MSNYSKIYITSTVHAPSQLNFTDVPVQRLFIMPLRDFEITQYNTVADYLASSIFIQGLRDDWFIAHNEYGQDIDQLMDVAVDLQSSSYLDGQVPTYDDSTNTFIPTTPSGGGGSDSFLNYTLTATTDETITHTFGRPANVKVFEGGEEIDCLITYPVGFETSKVRIQANQPVTGFAILT